MNQEKATANFQEVLKGKNGEIENLQRKLTDKEAEVKRTLKNLEGINWEIKSIQKKLDDKEAKVKQALASLEESKGEIKNLQKKLTDKEAEIKRAIAGFEEIKRDYETRIAQLKKEAEDKMRLVENARTQLIKLSQQLG